MRRVDRRPKGDGSITKRANGVFQGRVDLGIGPTGERIRRTVTGKTQQECAKRMRDLRRDFESSGGVAVTNTKGKTVGDAIELYLRSQRNKLRIGKIKPRTVEYNLECSKRCSDITGLRLHQVTPSVLEDWSANIVEKYAPSTARGSWFVVARALQAARREGWMLANPLIDLEPPAGRRVDSSTHATEADVQMILEKAGNPWRTLWAVMAYTGMRPGEARGLRWEHMDLERERILVQESGPELTGSPKTTNSRRDLPIPSMVQTEVKRLWLQQGRPEEGLLFPCAADRSNVAKAFKKVAPHGLTPKSLRHGVATRLLEQGTPVHVVASILGHSSPNVTLSVYSHSVASLESAALEQLSQGTG